MGGMIYGKNGWWKEWLVERIVGGKNGWWEEWGGIVGWKNGLSIRRMAFWKNVPCQSHVDFIMSNVHN